MRAIDGIIETTLCPTPCDATPEESNAPERALTAAQHRICIADKLMDWMESQQITYARASDICGVSTHIIVSMSNRASINIRVFRKIAHNVPGLLEHIEGAN